MKKLWQERNRKEKGTTEDIRKRKIKSRCYEKNDEVEMQQRTIERKGNSEWLIAMG
jgi:hypothetical protein